MKFTIKVVVIPMLLFSSACHVAVKSASTKRSEQSDNYTEHTCTFGKYGSITVHEGGIDDIYIVVNRKKYPSYGGENFVQSKDDIDVVMMFDRQGNPSYRGEIPGRNCRVSRH